jgi:hypothetical protein
MTEKMNINVFIPKNNSFFVAIVAVLLLFSVVLYAFPAAFVFLFNDILGNLLLLLGVIGVGYLDFRWGVGLAAIFVILYQAFSLSKTEGRPSKTGNTEGREGFTQWSSKVKTDFVNFENTHNPNFQFDMNIIQKQASPEEVEYLIKNNKWPWSESVKAMYKDAVMRNSVISMDPGVAMDVAQTIYNETAVKELLSWNTKEGAFLLTGVTVGHTKGLPDNINNIVRCGTSDSNGNGNSSSNSNGGAVMEKITNVGYDGINGSMIKNYAPVPDAEIPKLVPGFKFLKGECNPCVALNDPANYSCPFSLNVGDGGEVSTIWKDLWGLVSGGSSSNVGGGSVKKEFPLLNELKDELNKASSFLGVGGAGAAAAAGAGGKPVVYEDAVSTPDALHNNDSTESPFLNSNM